MLFYTWDCVLWGFKRVSALEVRAFRVLELQGFRALGF